LALSPKRLSAPGRRRAGWNTSGGEIYPIKFHANGRQRAHIPPILEMVPGLLGKKLYMRNFNVATPNTVPTIAHSPEHNEILKPANAAAYLQLSPSTLAKLRLCRTGPRYAKASRAMPYRRSDPDASIDALRTDSPTDTNHRSPKRMSDLADVGGQLIA